MRCTASADSGAVMEPARPASPDLQRRPADRRAVEVSPVTGRKGRVGRLVGEVHRHQRSTRRAVTSDEHQAGPVPLDPLRRRGVKGRVGPAPQQHTREAGPHPPAPIVAPGVAAVAAGAGQSRRERLTVAEAGPVEVAGHPRTGGGLGVVVRPDERVDVDERHAGECEGNRMRREMPFERRLVVATATQLPTTWPRVHRVRGRLPSRPGSPSLPTSGTTPRAGRSVPDRATARPAADPLRRGWRES